MIKLREERGFSLVELMIVVAIMAILAAIAIPSFMRFQLKAKTSEATSNIAAIRGCEVAYETENDEYLGCAIAPRGAASPPAADALNDTKTAWADNAGGTFEMIGFAPEGAVRYAYDVLCADTTTFAVHAYGNLDEDDTIQTFTIDLADDDYPNVERSGDI